MAYNKENVPLGRFSEDSMALTVFGGIPKKIRESFIICINYSGIKKNTACNQTDC